MMQSIDAERQMVREVELKTRQRRKYLISTVVLALLSTGLLAGLIALSVVHIRHLQQCSTTVTDSSSSSPNDLSNAPGPIGPIGLPEAPPTKRRIVVVPVSARHESHYPRPTGTGTSNSTFSSPNNKGTCEAGHLYGGRQLDQLNHDAYMPLMQKALSLSPAAQSGDVRDYYHASLRSIFRCVDGESMDIGGIELVAACKGGYVIDGGEVGCDGDGSYEGGSETSAPASPSSGSPYAGI